MLFNSHALIACDIIAIWLDVHTDGYWSYGVGWFWWVLKMVRLLIINMERSLVGIN